MACYDIWCTTRANLDTFYLTFFSRLFLIHSDIDIANFVDNNATYLSAKYIEDVIESPERTSISMFRWSENKLLKGNEENKRHFLVSTTLE